ncbi:MAG TPA: hypothetical protein VFN23_07070 [Ktedonobacteraceae bacterium]|nr:hypothetical protein [Ktedonobacteraceae bacterium]
MNKKLQQMIEQARLRAAQAIAPPALLQDKIHICGRIRAREVPFESEAEWRFWWLPERDSVGKIIRPARMLDREKERYTVAESQNILVSAGITQVLNYIGSTSGNATGFAQYFAVGSTGLAQVESNDTIVAGEYFRAVPSLASISGVQQDISVFAGTTQANGNITNAGLWGNGATSTLGSGVLMTHSLFQYTKSNSSAVTFDYLLSYS